MWRSLEEKIPVEGENLRLVRSLAEEKRQRQNRCAARADKGALDCVGIKGALRDGAHACLQRTVAVPRPFPER